MCRKAWIYVELSGKDSKTLQTKRDLTSSKTKKYSYHQYIQNHLATDFSLGKATKKLINHKQSSSSLFKSNYSWATTDIKKVNFFVEHLTCDFQPHGIYPNTNQLKLIERSLGSPLLKAFPTEHTCPSENFY